MPRDFTAGQQSGEVKHLSDLSVQLVIISLGCYIIELCVLCAGILGLEIYGYKSGWHIVSSVAFSQS